MTARRRSFATSAGCALFSAALVAGCSGGSGSSVPASGGAVATPSAMASTASVLKAGQDGTTDTCAASANACVIAGQTVTSASWIPILCDVATNPSCTGAGTWQYAAAPSGSTAGITWAFALAQVGPNQMQTYTVAAQSAIAPATYAFAITSIWTPGTTGPMNHSFTGEVQVTCSLNAGTCKATPAPNPSVVCLPTPGPEAGAAAGGFARARGTEGSATGATPSPGTVVYVSPC